MRWGALRYDGVLRRYARELKGEPATHAELATFNARHAGEPFENNADDGDVTQARSLPPIAVDNMVAPVKLARSMRYKDGWAGPTTVGLGLAIVVLGLLSSRDPAKEYVPRDQQRGYNTAERTVLESPGFMQALGLCKADLDKAVERYRKDDNMDRVSSLEPASRLAERYGVDCEASVVAMGIIVGQQTVNVTAADILFVTGKGWKANQV